MLKKIRPILNIVFIIFGIYVLYSLWMTETPKKINIDTVPSENGNSLPTDAIPLGTITKEIWGHDSNGPSKGTSEEFYYTPNNTGMYYDHQYWLDNEAHCY